MTDYNTLVAARTVAGSIKNLSNVSDADADGVLDKAEQYIARRLRVRQMLATATGTATASSSSVSLPARCLQVRAFRFTGTAASKLTQKTLENVEDSFSYDASGNRSTGKPQNFYIDGSDAVFEVLTQSAYPYRMRYYEQLAPLDSTATSNFLTTTAVRALESACLAFVADFRKDQKERDYWLAQAVAEINELNSESDLSERAEDMGAVIP